MLNGKLPGNNQLKQSTDLLQMSKAAPGQGMNTAQIWLNLYRKGNQIADSIPDSNPELRLATANDAQAATTLSKLKGVTQLNALKSDIQTYLNDLGNFKSTIELQQVFAAQFKPQDAQLQALMGSRNQLLEQLSKLIKQQYESVGLFTKMAEGKISPQEARQQLNGFRQQQDAVTESVNKLQLAEDSLRKELEAMRTQTKSARDAVSPAPVKDGPAPSRPTGMSN